MDVACGIVWMLFKRISTEPYFLKNKENVTSDSDTVSHECLRNAKPEPLTPSKLDKHKLLLSSNNFSVVSNVTICMVGGV